MRPWLLWRVSRRQCRKCAGYKPMRSLWCWSLRNRDAGCQQTQTRSLDPSPPGPVTSRASVPHGPASLEGSRALTFSQQAKIDLEPQRQEAGKSIPYDNGLDHRASPTANMATELTVQSERAFQKQPHIFLNQKVKAKSTRVGKGGRRWYKDVGLGFRTPKTAIEGTYIGTL